MKRFFHILLLAVFASLVNVVAQAADAPERSVTERLEDIEAYINNAARNGTTNAPSKIAGPGQIGRASCRERV